MSWLEKQKIGEMDLSCLICKKKIPVEVFREEHEYKNKVWHGLRVNKDTGQFLYIKNYFEYLIKLDPKWQYGEYIYLQYLLGASINLQLFIMDCLWGFLL